MPRMNLTNFTLMKRKFLSYILMAQQMWKWLRVEPQREPHQRLIIGKAGVYNHFFQQTAYRQGAKARKAKKTAFHTKS